MRRQMGVGTGNRRILKRKQIRPAIAIPDCRTDGIREEGKYDWSLSHTLPVLCRSNQRATTRLAPHNQDRKGLEVSGRGRASRSLKDSLELGFLNLLSLESPDRPSRVKNIKETLVDRRR
jgi:hypothetical protein